MSDFEKEKRKRKRIKLECLSCGSTFDDHYCRKHEKQVHNREKVKMKHHGAKKNTTRLLLEFYLTYLVY